jgi:hypothetical protein
MGDFRQRAMELATKGHQYSQQLKKYKEKYAKYKELYDIGGKLLDPDSRRATAYKEGLKLLLKRAGKVLGKDLTKHPYFIINQAAMEVLWETIEVTDTIDNARKQLEKAEKSLDEIRPKAKAFAKKHNKELNETRSQIKAKLTASNSLGFNWTQQLNQMSRDRFRRATRAEAIDEIESLLDITPILLRDLRPIVTVALKQAPDVLEGFAALSAAGADIILAEKLYNEKIGKLADSKRTIGRAFGRLEQKRRMEEEVMGMLKNKRGAGRPFQERVSGALNGVRRCARGWTDLVDTILSLDILLVGSSSGYLPWEMTLPPAGRGPAR